jgi:succinoglycan biosynthesis protein ExoA
MSILVSVIVPVRNEGRCIQQTLEGLLNQHFDPDQFEVIVVDGLSEDDTVAKVQQMAARFQHLQIHSNPKRLSSAARNIGVEHASGEFVVVVDGHCRVENRDYLKNLVVAFRQSEADSLGRPQPLQAPNPTEFQKAVSSARASWLGHNPDSAIYSDRAGYLPAQNVAVAYRREVFFKLGGFDERFDACEDVDFNTRLDRAGLSCFFTPSIRLDYHPRNTLRGLMVQMQRYGQGRARLARKHPSSITLPSLVPPLWVLSLVACGLLGFLQPLFWAMLAVSLFSYLVVVLGESARLSRGRFNGSTLRLPVVFCAIHFGYALGFLKEMVKIPVPRFTSFRKAKTSPASDLR